MPRAHPPSRRMTSVLGGDKAFASSRTVRKVCVPAPSRRSVRRHRDPRRRTTPQVADGDSIDTRSPHSSFAAFRSPSERSSAVEWDRAREGSTHSVRLLVDRRAAPSASCAPGSSECSSAAKRWSRSMTLAGGRHADLASAAGRRQRGSHVESPTALLRNTRNTRNKLRPDATCVPRETISKKALCRLRPVSVSRVDVGVYSGRRPHRRVNTQCSNLFVATRPLSSIKLAVREKASRISPVGSAVTTPTPDHGEPSAGEFGDEGGPACTLPGCPAAVACCAPGSATGSVAGGTAWPAGAADPRPAMARVASARSPVRASSIIPSNRPRIETPRRCASASTQARRSWSRRIPTTVDLEVAMTSLTVIRGVYSSGAERWQAGGGRRALASLPDRLGHASVTGRGRADVARVRTTADLERARRSGSAEAEAGGRREEREPGLR
jgi:hypothetical protein